MTAMVQEMSWDAVSSTEGKAIVDLTPTEMDEVGGGWWPVALAIVGAGAAGFATGTFFGWLSRQK